MKNERNLDFVNRFKNNMFENDCSLFINKRRRRDWRCEIFLFRLDANDELSIIVNKNFVASSLRWH